MNNYFTLCCCNIFLRLLGFYVTAMWLVLHKLSKYILTVCCRRYDKYAGAEGVVNNDFLCWEPRRDSVITSSKPVLSQCVLSSHLVALWMLIADRTNVRPLFPSYPSWWWTKAENPWLAVPGGLKCVVMRTLIELTPPSLIKGDSRKDFLFCIYADH